MAQFLRPDSNITQTSFTNGFAEIDESTFSDADYAWGADNQVAVLEVGLTNPTGTPYIFGGDCTVRYRIAKVDGGVYPGTGGNNLTITTRVFQGAAQIAVSSAITAPDAWTAQSFTFDAIEVADWNNLRLRFTTTASAGGGPNRRGGAVSWAEIEVPDPEILGQIKVWTGSEWVPKPFKVYNGATWETSLVKYYDGSIWVTTPY